MIGITHVIRWGVTVTGMCTLSIVNWVMLVRALIQENWQCDWRGVAPTMPIASTKCSFCSLGGGSSIQWTTADKFQTQHPTWTKRYDALDIQINKPTEQRVENFWRIWKERLSPNPRRTTWQSSGKRYLRSGSSNQPKIKLFHRELLYTSIANIKSGL